MPIYRYVCRGCGLESDAWRAVDERNDAPAHCSTPMERRIMPTAVKVFTPYMPVASEKEDGTRHLIRSQAQHEAFLRRNGYEEVGNDKSMAPPSQEDLRGRKHRWADGGVDIEKLKRDGFVQEDLAA